MAVHISTNPTDIAAIRAAADAEADALYPEALERVRAGGYLIPDQTAVLRHRRDRAAADLRAVADAPTGSPAGRVSAAMALAEIGDAGGAERAAAFLANPSRELRVEALKRLNSDGCEAHIDWSIPAAREALFRLIADPDEHVALTAAALAALDRVPGAEVPVLARLDAGRVSDRVRWAGALSGVAHTPEAAARAAAELFRNPPDRYWPRSLMYNLYWVSRHPDPAVREPAWAAAREFCLRYMSGTRTEVLVGDFARVAGPEDVPLLEEIAATHRSRGVRSLALDALARLDPTRAVDRVLADTARRPLGDWHLSILLEHATDADAGRVIPLVRPRPRDFRPDFDVRLERVVQLMLQLGEAGRAELRQWAGRLRGDLRARAEWGLRGITLRPALEALTAAGALPGDADALVARMRPDPGTELDDGDPGLVARAFGWAGRAVTFDVGYGPVERDRDRLRAFTAERTGGLFVPECPVVEPHGDAPDSPATVRFVHGGRAFAFEATVGGDFHDVSAVTAAANAALEASDRPERFLVLPTDVSGPVLILTDPARYRPVAARFHLPADTPGTRV